MWRMVFWVAVILWAGGCLAGDPLTADDRRTENGPYMVVDLSGGSSAANYPVSYLNGVPSGGWTDEHKTTKLVMRRIPAGTFTMGSPPDELSRDDDELQHRVTLTKDFYIGVFEVTQRQWELVMGSWPSYFSNTTYYQTRPVEQVTYSDIRGYSAGTHWPANDAVDAESFMGRLRAKTGLTTLDLPTESQWEYACRAGTITALNSGKNLTVIGNCPNMSEIGRYWYNGGSGESQDCATNTGTAPVGSYLPNAWGIYDMHGNVDEWCLDWCETYPEVAQDPGGAPAGTSRVMRGGSFISLAWGCRSAGRSVCGQDCRCIDAGFRVARTLR